MKHKHQAGFSLIELLMVISVILILATLSTAFYIRARVGAENRAAVAHLTLLRSTQAQFFTSRNRFARFDELNQSQNPSGAGIGNLGQVINPTTLRRGRYTFTLMASDDNTLREGYLITATRDSDTPIPFVYTLDQTGVIDGVTLF